MSSWKRLGELMSEHGYVTPEQVEEALKVQSKPGESRLLGQILISRGYATAPQIQVALAKQKQGEQAPHKPAPKPNHT
ncbi:MAG: hypothetical protein K8T26_09010 [Lentisphaerae bacterium]|nr:hypothetical protein [Lentisphaerota bacterium]